MKEKHLWSTDESGTGDSSIPGMLLETRTLGGCMEIFALILLNLFFGAGLYLFLSVRMSKLLQESQGKQLEKTVMATYVQFIRDSQNSMELLESKIKGLRDLVQRAEANTRELREEIGAGTGVSLQMQNLINQAKDILDGHNLSSTKKNLGTHLTADLLEESQPVSARHEQTSTLSTIPEELYTTPSTGVGLSGKLPNANPYTDYRSQSNPPLKAHTSLQSNRQSIAQPSSQPMIPRKETLGSPQLPSVESEGIIAGIGKRVKGIMGITGIGGGTGTLGRSTNSGNTRMDIPPVTQQLAMVVAGDPFEDESNAMIRDEVLEKKNEEGSFSAALKEASRMGKPGDSIHISPESVLAELPPSMKKIDRVVHLLKRGFSHEEIADALDLGAREVSLIETVRLDRGRRV